MLVPLEWTPALSLRVAISSCRGRGEEASRGTTVRFVRIERFERPVCAAESLDSYEPYEAPGTRPSPFVAEMGSTVLEHLKARLQVRVMDTEAGATSGGGTDSTTAARMLLKIESRLVAEAQDFSRVSSS